MQTLEVGRGQIAPLHVGDYDVPLTVLSDLEDNPYTIEVEGEEYTYLRSVPIKGHGATLPPLLVEYWDEGRDILIGERAKRYYIYGTQPTVSAGAAAGAVEADTE